MTKLRSTSVVIDALGGNQPVAEMLSVTTAAVSNWRGFAVFPAYTYVVITNALKEKGLAAPDRLWAMRRPTGKRARTG
jgi:hypothetical protein